MFVDDSLDNGTFSSGPSLWEHPSHRELAGIAPTTSHPPIYTSPAHETTRMATPAHPTCCNHCRPGEVPEPILTAMIVAEVSRQLRQSHPSMNPLVVDSSVLSIPRDNSWGFSHGHNALDPLLFSAAEPLCQDDPVSSQSTAPEAPPTDIDEMEDLFLSPEVGNHPSWELSEEKGF